VELWLGRNVAKCESLSGEGRMDTNDSVYSPGSTDCGLYVKIPLQISRGIFVYGEIIQCTQSAKVTMQ